MLNETLKPMAAPLIGIMTIISKLLTITVIILPAEEEASPPDTTQIVRFKITKMSINQRSMGTLIEYQGTKKDSTTMASHRAK